MNERRLDSRCLCAELVRVVWRAGHDRDSRGQVRTAEGVLEDISPLGACVQIEEAIPIGTPVVISADGSQFFGDVSYCVFRDYGYFVGLRLSDETRWSSGTFSPQHMTDLRTLAFALGGREEG